MIATYQPAAYSGTGWANPGNVLGADGSVAINGSGNGLLILTRTGFVIPTGYEPVGFVIRFTGGTSLATTSTTFGVGYQLEVAAANTATAGKVTDGVLGDETTFIGAVVDAGGLTVEH